MDDLFLLSRLQFVLNVSAHIIFPTITISLSWVVLFLRWRWGKTQDQAWLDAYYLWTKIFALTFAMGVVTGITMSFQFGTNWPGFMEKAGNIAGPLLGYEVLTAFFLEAGFLGIMLYGKSRVSQRVHLWASFIVSFGTLISAFWILSLNSWMQTPQGITVDTDGVIHVSSWLEVVFNPSFPYRFAHMLLASGLTTAFLLMGISAWQILKGHGSQASNRILKLGSILGTLLIVVQIFVGDMHGLNTLKHQPAKIAAMEGVWETHSSVPLLLFAIPDATEKKNHFEIAIPSGASLILTHKLDGEIKGLNEFEHTPPVSPIFFSFRVMVGAGMFMLLLSWYSVYRLRKVEWQAHRLARPLLWVLAGSTFIGWIATLAGWYVTEIGRQPFLVYGHLLTKDAVTTMQPTGTVLFSFIAYMVFYIILIAAYMGIMRYLVTHVKSSENEAV